MTRVVIVGAGPGGLVTCKTLLGARNSEFPFDPIVLEQEDEVGGTVRYRSYENANLVSSKYLTSFSDFRLPLKCPDHLTLQAYCEYLSAYAVAFGVMERIKFRSRVVRISKCPSGGHLVSYLHKPAGSEQWNQEPVTIHTPYVVVCTGLHVTPSIPDIPGIQHILDPSPPREKDRPKPQVFHSADYKSRAQLAGRRVCVLGTGETGADIAYNAAQAGAKEVVLCSRAGFLHVPKVLNGLKIMGIKFTGGPRPLPIDTWTTNLVGTAYVHPWVAASRLRWILSDSIISRISWLLTGSSFGCNQLVGEREIKSVGRAYVHFNKSPKVMPYLNRPYRNKWRDFICSYIEPEEDIAPNNDFVVDLAPFPSRVFSSGQMIFPVSARKDSVRMAGRDFRPDTVVFATGYTHRFEFLDKGYAAPGELEIRNVVSSGDHTIAFVGFLRPSLGAIPPIAEMQSMLWVQLIKGEVQLPLSPPYYELLAGEDYRIKHGVDHSAYISTLARDIGAAPGLWELWWEYGTKVFLCYCLGATYVPFYRLVGPFQDPKAPEIVKTELWETITRRGIPGLVLGSLLPMAFYSLINITAWILAGMLRLARQVGISCRRRVDATLWWLGRSRRHDKV